MLYKYFQFFFLTPDEQIGNTKMHSRKVALHDGPWPEVPIQTWVLKSRWVVA